jgi:hypothetical protein
MKTEELIDIMTRHKLSRADIAALAGKTTRQAFSWEKGIFAVPRTLALILYALDEGRVDIRWVIGRIHKEITGEDRP